jgi:predicted RNase H-like nuclease (RuvC/YqgF family)
MTDPLIPTPEGLPPGSAGWATATVLGLLALGKPALDAWRGFRAKSLNHAQNLELRHLTTREQEDRDIIAMLRGDIAVMQKRLDKLEALNSELAQENSRLREELAVANYRLAHERPTP